MTSGEGTAHRVHWWLTHHASTAWACAILRCDERVAPQACVLLLLSAVMTVCTLAMGLAGFR